MRRATIVVALALSLLGCGGEPVQLLTSSDAEQCMLDFKDGPLTVDARYGTAISDENGRNDTREPAPVMWPEGYTGRRVGSDVEILDPSGKVVAMTGRRYHIEGGLGTNASGERGFVACVQSITPK